MPSGSGILIYGLGALACVGVLAAIARKYGGLGLLVASAPIHRLSVDVGFSLKLLYLVALALMIRSLLGSRSDPFTFKTNQYFRTLYWLLASIVFSALINGASITSVRHIVAFVFVCAVCYLIYRRIRTVEDVSRLTDIYLFTGLLLGSSGLFFYGFYFVRPDLYVEGSLFDAISYEEERAWTVPLLKSVDVGSNGYALTLIPFLFSALGTILVPTASRKRKAFGLATYVLLLINLGLTFSRAAVVAALLGTALFIFYKKGNPTLKWILALSVVALLASSPQIAEWYKDYSTLKGSYHEGSDVASLLSERDELFYSSVDVFVHHPLFGVGLGNIVDAKYLGKEAHNTYIELLAENGIVVFAIFVFIALSMLRRVVIVHRATRSSDGFYYTFTSFAFGLLTLLIALVSTSAFLMPLLWIQITTIAAMASIACRLPPEQTLVGREAAG